MEFIDEDELESLAAALAYFRQNRQKRVSEARTDAEFTYNSKGGFRVGFFVDPGKRSGDYFQVSSHAVFPKDLASLEKTVTAAQQRIRELRAK